MKINFPFLLILLVGIIQNFLDARELYVSNSGSFRNAGTIESPLSTLGRALSFAQEGDTILLERGSVFREFSISLDRSLTVTSYGDTSLPLPIIQGSEAVTGWSPWAENPNVYVASFDSTPSQFYVDGSLVRFARTPDQGWLRDDDGTDSNLIVDAELKTLPGNTSQRWRGAQIRWRKWSWWYETRPILADDGNGNLTLGGSTFSNKHEPGAGYYIDNSLQALDAPGEWYWDSETNLVYYHPPLGMNPNDMECEAMVRDTGVVISDGKLSGIHLRYFISSGVSVSGKAVVEDCVVEHCEDVGINGGSSSTGSQIRRCEIRDILNLGISWRERNGSGQTIIEDNHLLRIGMIPGYGGSGSWHGAGVLIRSGLDIQFRYNRLEYTGYAGIIVGDAGQTVERNVFRFCMSTLNDGAAIYTNCGDTLIRENIILDTIGDLESCHPWYSIGHGIWPEFLGNYSNNQIIGNTVYGSGGNGLWLPNNFNALVQGNKLLSNLHAGLDIGGFEPGRSDGMFSQNNTFLDNLVGDTVFPYQPLEPQNHRYDNVPLDIRLTYHRYEDRDLDYGTMSGTIFLIRDPNDPLVGSSVGGSVGTIISKQMKYMSLSEWLSNEPDWADVSPQVVVGEGFLFINDTKVEQTFPLGGDLPTEGWLSLAGIPHTGDVVVAPFASVVLYRSETEGIGELPPYFLASDVFDQDVLSYADWIARYSLFGDANDPHADPDLDGASNLFEYFAGTLPNRKEPRNSGALQLVLDEKGTALRISRRTVATTSAIRAYLQSTENFINWTTETELQEGTQESDWMRHAGAPRESLHIPVESNPSEMRAWRVVVELVE